jgi:hypothetical protein
MSGQAALMRLGVSSVKTIKVRPVVMRHPEIILAGIKPNLSITTPRKRAVRAKITFEIV